MNCSRYVNPRVTTGSVGVTRFERSKAVTTTAVIPGSLRAADQPPPDSWRERRKATALAVISSIVGLAAARLARDAAAPAHAQTPRARTPRPRKPRREVVAKVSI